MLRKAKAGIPARELCCRYAISDAIFYTWHQKFGGMDVPEVKRLKSLEEDNSLLKKLLAELCSTRRRFRWLRAESSDDRAEAGSR